MSTISFIRKGILAIVPIICLSFCQKITEEDLNEENSSEKNEIKELSIKTRSASNSDIEFPLYAYVFKENGDFLSFLKVKSVNDSIKFFLGKGNFKIVTISNCGEDYSINEKPSINDVIKFKSETSKYANKSLMMGISSVTVDNKNINVDLNMSYCVSSVQVELYGIPVSTKKVKFTMSPIYNSISYNNEYQKSSTGDELSLDCYLGIDGVWKAGPVYIFPGYGESSSFKIVLEKDSSVNTYSYTFKGAAKASQPFIIKGSFIGEVSINGNVLAKGWDNAVVVQFDFSSSSGNEPSNNNNNNNNNNQGEQNSGTPQLGEIWNGCIVANAETETGGIKLLLLSLKEWQCKITETKDIVSSYSVNGITEWAIPTWEQATYLKNYFNESKLDELNTKIEKAGGDPIYDDTDTRFLCYNKDSYISSFRFSASSDIRKTSDESRLFYLRLAKSYLYKP